jgi:hypothetical protein
MALFMVIEHFRPGEAQAVYRRFRERGRMAPDGACSAVSCRSLE